MATIIKRGFADPASTSGAVQGVAFDLEEMAAHGDRYLDQVRQEAAKIVQKANADAQRVREQAEQAGRQAAEQAIDRVLGDKVNKQMQTLRPAIEGVAAEIVKQRTGWLTHWETAAVWLAGRIAERIVRRELTHTPEITVEWARDALAMVAGSSELTVRLHPDDHANLGENVTAVAGAVAKAAETTVVADEGVSPGGCVVQTRHGVIDAQVEQQIARMMDELL